MESKVGMLFCCTPIAVVKLSSGNDMLSSVLSPCSRRPSLMYMRSRGVVVEVVELVEVVVGAVLAVLAVVAMWIPHSGVQVQGVAQEC